MSAASTSKQLQNVHKIQFWGPFANFEAAYDHVSNSDVVHPAPESDTPLRPPYGCSKCKCPSGENLGFMNGKLFLGHTFRNHRSKDLLTLSCETDIEKLDNAILPQLTKTAWATKQRTSPCVFTSNIDLYNTADGMFIMAKDVDGYDEHITTCQGLLKIEALRKGFLVAYLKKLRSSILRQLDAADTEEVQATAKEEYNKHTAGYADQMFRNIIAPGLGWIGVELKEVTTLAEMLTKTVSTREEFLYLVHATDVMPLTLKELTRLVYADVSFCPFLHDLKIKSCTRSKVNAVELHAVNYFGMNVDHDWPWTKFNTPFAEARYEVTTWLCDHSNKAEAYKVLQTLKVTDVGVITTSFSLPQSIEKGKKRLKVVKGQVSKKAAFLEEHDEGGEPRSVLISRNPLAERSGGPGANEGVAEAQLAVQGGHLPMLATSRSGSLSAGNDSRARDALLRDIEAEKTKNAMLKIRHDALWMQLKQQRRTDDTAAGPSGVSGEPPSKKRCHGTQQPGTSSEMSSNAELLVCQLVAKADQITANLAQQQRQTARLEEQVQASRREQEQLVDELQELRKLLRHLQQSMEQSHTLQQQQQQQQQQQTAYAGLPPAIQNISFQ